MSRLELLACQKSHSEQDRRFVSFAKMPTQTDGAANDRPNLCSSSWSTDTSELWHATHAVLQGGRLRTCVGFCLRVMQQDVLAYTYIYVHSYIAIYA